MQIKDVFFLNETLKENEMGDSLLFLFEKVIAVNADSLCIESQERKERIICQSDYESWESVIEYLYSFKYPYRRWIDTFLSCEDGNEKFSRLIDEYKIYISNGQIEYIDRLYKFADINRTVSKSQIFHHEKNKKTFSQLTKTT